MKSVYTTTIVNEARKCGIRVEVLDESLPVFVLKKGRKSVRCFNALTDNVGAASFVMAQNKRAANSFLRQHGISVPAQESFVNFYQAMRFLKKCKTIVVKPSTQWGGKGVSVAIKNQVELKYAIRTAQKYEEDVILEQCVCGEDFRLIFVNYKFVAAIRRRPAVIIGDGRSSVLSLIKRTNRTEYKIDPSHQIPLDVETQRALRQIRMSYGTIPAKGVSVQVRLNSNYHTGGTVNVVTDKIDSQLLVLAKKVVRLVGIPVIGVDFLFDKIRNRYWVIELSPDLAISPPEGYEVARHLIRYLFPSKTRSV